jgi:hypothetical protein
MADRDTLAQGAFRAVEMAASWTRSSFRCGPLRSERQQVVMGRRADAGYHFVILAEAASGSGWNGTTAMQRPGASTCIVDPGHFAS